MSEGAFDPNKVHAGKRMSDKEFAEFRAAKQAEQAAALKKHQENLPPKQAGSTERPKATDPENPYRSMAEDMGNNNPEGRQTPSAEQSAELQRMRKEQSAQVQDMIDDETAPPSAPEHLKPKQKPDQPVKKSWLARLFGR